MRMVALAQVAEITPRGPSRNSIPADGMGDFVPMAPRFRSFERMHLISQSRRPDGESRAML